MRGPLFASFAIRSKKGGSDQPRSPKTSRDNRILIIECQLCQGKKNLIDSVCLRCSIKALSSHIGVNEIMLSSDSDIAYGGKCVDALRELAEVLRNCEVSSKHLRSRSICSDCESNPDRIIAGIRANFPQGWREAEKRIAAHPPRLSAQCASCWAGNKALVASISTRMRSLERGIAREAFMVVEAEQHA